MTKKVEVVSRSQWSLWDYNPIRQNCNHNGEHGLKSSNYHYHQHHHHPKLTINLRTLSSLLSTNHIAYTLSLAVCLTTVALYPTTAMTAHTMLTVFHPPHPLLWSSCSNHSRHSRGQCCSQFELEEQAVVSPGGPPCEEEGVSLPLLFTGCCKMGSCQPSSEIQELWQSRQITRL